MAGAIIVIVSCLIPTGCDRRKPASETPIPAVDHSNFTSLTLQLLAPLPAYRATHIAADAAGVVYWSQETSEQKDVLFRLGADGVPRTADLSTRAILDAMAVRDGAGNIQSIAITNGQILFYFHGGSGVKTLACLGQFDPRTSVIHILCDTPTLMSQSGMGLTLDLARGKILVTPREAWLFLAHTDEFALFKLDLTGNTPDVVLGKSISVRSDAGPIALNAGGLHVSAGAKTGLLALDTRVGRLWQISEEGIAMPIFSLVGISSHLSDPLAESDRIFVFAAAGDLIEPVTVSDLSPPIISTSYPALLCLAQPTSSATSARSMEGSPNIDVTQLQIRTLCNDPSTNGWLAYDAVSGELMRLLPSRG